MINITQTLPELRTHYRGRLWIHAGTRRDNNPQPTFTRLGIVVPAQLEYGAILGCVEVVGVTQSSPSPWAIADSYHWEIANPFLLKTPIPAKGQLGLWSYNQ